MIFSHNIDICSCFSGHDWLSWELEVTNGQTVGAKFQHLSHKVQWFAFVYWQEVAKCCPFLFYGPNSFSEAAPVDPRCGLSLDQGTCRTYNSYWYYDKRANSCAQFWYGGCGGNGNRFETEDECKKTCVISLHRTGNMHKLFSSSWIHYFAQFNLAFLNIFAILCPAG